MPYLCCCRLVVTRVICAVCVVCEQDAADWGGPANEGLLGDEVILDAQEGVYYGHTQRPAEMVSNNQPFEGRSEFL